MRTNILTRTLLATATTVALAAGSVAAAGTSFAAPATAHPAAAPGRPPPAGDNPRRGAPPAPKVPRRRATNWSDPAAHHGPRG
ncbi:peptidoglycan-binding protein, partial [Streptomyces sp. NPDC004658]